jgi:membrane protease YdiL (CAAX protease family)
MDLRDSATWRQTVNLREVRHRGIFKVGWAFTFAAAFGPLLRQVTKNQAISMTAVLFGIAHYHGTPSGFPGMGLTFIAGWIFGLAMVETRSILLPWLLHFVPDAAIYVASALQTSSLQTRAIGLISKIS